MSFKIVRDTIGPHVGQWIVEDDNGHIIEGPFDTKRDAEESLATRENWRQFYAHASPSIHPDEIGRHFVRRSNQ